jgi:hypothetical protein
MTRHSKSCLRHITAAVCGLLFLQTPLSLFAQSAQAGNPSTESGQPVELLSADQLNDLVAPVALYPDPLISQILVAATYPIELVQAQQWLQRQPGLKGSALTAAAQQQNWDPSIQALLIFPDVMKRLNDDIDWTTNLGNAFLAQQTDVMNAIQRMRLSAQGAGKLVSTSQQQVLTTTEAGEPVVTVMPVNPNVIYVPVYDPVWVWGPAVYYSYPRWYFAPHPAGLSFSVGISIGSFLEGGWNGWGGWGWYPRWSGHTIVVNNSFIERYHFNSAHLAVRSGTSVWVHDPWHRHGVPYPTHALAERFPGRTRENLRPNTTHPLPPHDPSRGTLGRVQNPERGFRSHASQGLFHSGPGAANSQGHASWR